MTPNIPSDPQRLYRRMSGWTLAYTDAGAGPRHVMIHGLPGSARDFRWLGACLEPLARVIRLDLPGFGESVHPERGRFDTQARGAQVIEAIEALGIDHVTLVAHSMGGVVACEVAAQRPELIDRVVLLASASVRPHYPQRLYQVVSQVMEVPGVERLVAPLLKALFVRLGFSAALPAEEFVQTIHDAARVDFERHARNVRALFERDMPMFVAWAEDDHLISTTHSLELARAAAPGVRMRFERGGHNIQKTHAVELAEAIMRFGAGEREDEAQAVGR